MKHLENSVNKAGHT